MSHVLLKLVIFLCILSNIWQLTSTLLSVSKDFSNLVRKHNLTQYKPCTVCTSVRESHGVYCLRYFCYFYIQYWILSSDTATTVCSTDRKMHARAISATLYPNISLICCHIQFLASGHCLTALQPVAVDDVITLIQRLPDKSCVADTLPVPQLKLVADLVAPFLTELFNRSLSVGIVPSAFKSALITPLLKKPDSDAADPR